MSQQQPPQPSNTPLLPIPIISLPQPLHPTTNKQPQLHPRQQLDIYKREYARLVRENSMLLAHLGRVTREKELLEAKYNDIQVQQQEQEEKRKRVRRTAGEIVREYGCYFEKCGKSYGTEASLCQHIKLKHPQGYGTPEYEAHISELRKKMGAKGTNITEAAQENPHSET